MSTALSQNLPESLLGIRTRRLFVLREAMPPLTVMGQTPDAFRRIGVIQGGSFEGEPLSGEVVTENEWQAVRTDSHACAPVRQTSLRNWTKARKSTPVGYYFRMNPMFETSSKKYDWMNRMIAVGTGVRLSDGPVYSIFEVL
jgi:hypothetical protein